MRLRRLRTRLSYANVTATLAVVIAMSTGAYALTLPDESVETRHLQDGAATTAKIRDDAVRTFKVDDRSLRAQDIARGQLPSWRGTWTASASYAPREIVVDDGASYIAVEPSTNAEPPAASWKLLAARGPAGSGAPGPEVDYQITSTNFDSSGVGQEILSFRGLRLLLACDHHPNTHESHLRLRAATTAEPATLEYVEFKGKGNEAGEATVRQLGIPLYTTPVLITDLLDFPTAQRSVLHFVYSRGSDFVTVDLDLRMVERFAPYDVTCYAKGTGIKGT